MICGLAHTRKQILLSFCMQLTVHGLVCTRSHAANTKVRAMVSRYVIYILTASSLLVMAVLVWQFPAEGQSGYGGQACFLRKASGLQLMVMVKHSGASWQTPTSITVDFPVKAGTLNVAAEGKTASSCRRVYCAPGREFISSGNGSCHSTFQHTNVYGYRFCLQTTTADFVNIRHYHLIWEHLRDFYYRSWDILDIFGLVMTSADLFKFPLEQFVETDLDALLLITNFIASKPFDRDVIDRAIMGNLSDITDTLSAHMNTSELRMAPTCSQLAFKVLMNIDNAAHPVSGVAGEHVLFMDYQTIDRADVTEFVPVTEHLTCPAVQLDPHQYSFDLRAGELYLNQSGRRVTGPYFYITDKLTALVCWKQYGGVVAQQAEVDKNRDDVLLIVDRVFVAVSLFFLVVSFVLYCLLPGLRSIAGINNMVLIVSLFCAQAFLHVGSYVPLNDWLCQAVGVATHFLWLCVVFAQNTCMFHMFYTLSFPLRSHAANTKVRAMVTRYVVYVLTASFVFVLAGLVWQFVSEGNSGYGGNGCFIRKSIVRISTFAVPLGLTVVANVAMFVFTIARLRALPSVSSTHSNRISMLLYTKLSVFTGVTWLFGFLATGLGSVEFSYVFVVLQDCQGLFVFLAFFANKRVLAMVGLTETELS
nr:hypothetical protein BaRGS_015971 [Batillaria attramentaria]